MDVLPRLLAGSTLRLLQVNNIRPLMPSQAPQAIKLSLCPCQTPMPSESNARQDHGRPMLPDRSQGKASIRRTRVARYRQDVNAKARSFTLIQTHATQHHKLVRLRLDSTETPIHQLLRLNRIVSVPIPKGARNAAAISSASLLYSRCRARCTRKDPPFFSALPTPAPGVAPCFRGRPDASFR